MRNGKNYWEICLSSRQQYSGYIVSDPKCYPHPWDQSGVNALILSSCGGFTLYFASRDSSFFWPLNSAEVDILARHADADMLLDRARVTVQR